MPVWFQNQLKRAFYQKDSSQVQLLNQCWFYYIQYTRKPSLRKKQTSVKVNN